MPKKKITIKEREMKIFYPKWMEDQPFPELLSYKNLVVKPEELKDINAGEGSKLGGIESGAMNLSLHDSDDLPEGATNQYLLDLAVTEQKLAAAAVTFEKVEKWFAGKMGISFPASPSDGEEFLRTDENIFYRYSASAEEWVAIDYHSDSDRFADDVIKSAKIESLNAGKITTGYLATARLDVAVAYITQQAMIAEAVIVNAHIDNLSAIKINAGIMTSRTVRTQASGKRVEMRGHGDLLPDELVFYNSSDTLMLQIFGGASEVVVKGSLDLRPICFQGPLGHYSLKVYETKVLSEHLQPVAANKDIGLSGNKWRHLHLSGNIYVAGDVDGVNISTFKSAYDTHVGNVSAHHNKYSSGIAITPSSVNTAYVDVTSYIETPFIYKDGTLIFSLATTSAACLKPFGFQVRAGIPGAASAFQGYMYYNTDQDDLVFSNGVNWYKVTAEQI